MKDEILDKVYSTDETPIPRYQIVDRDGNVVLSGVEIRLLNLISQLGTPYNTESILPDSVASKICPEISNPNPADAFAGLLPLRGGTMTGAIAMGGNKITGLGDPAADGDAAPKKYVDNLSARDVGAVSKNGDTMTGALTTPELNIASGDVWPGYRLYTEGNIALSGEMHFSSQPDAGNFIYFDVWKNSKRETFALPTYTNGRTADSWYSILTTKDSKDYVTAQGTSGNWHYRKYNSGYCECWCTAGQTVATTQWEAWGGIYLSQPLPSFDFPFPIYGATPNVTAHNVGGSTLGVATASDVSSKKMYEVRCFRGTKPSSSISVVYNVHVYGRWKE